MDRVTELVAPMGGPEAQPVQPRAVRLPAHARYGPDIAASTSRRRFLIRRCMGQAVAGAPHPDVYDWVTSTPGFAPVPAGPVRHDGSRSAQAVEYTTTSAQLAHDVKFMVELLGELCDGREGHDAPVGLPPVHQGPRWIIHDKEDGEGSDPGSAGSATDDPLDRACRARPGGLHRGVTTGCVPTHNTSTLLAAAKRELLRDPDKRILYIAFNRSVQVEANSKFPPTLRSAPRIPGLEGHGTKFTDKTKSKRGKGRDEEWMTSKPESVARYVGLNRAVWNETGGRDGNGAALNTRCAATLMNEAATRFMISADRAHRGPRRRRRGRARGGAPRQGLRLHPGEGQGGVEGLPGPERAPEDEPGRPGQDVGHVRAGPPGPRPVPTVAAAPGSRPGRQRDHLLRTRPRTSTRYWPRS